MQFHLVKMVKILKLKFQKIQINKVIINIIDEGPGFKEKRYIKNI